MNKLCVLFLFVVFQGCVEVRSQAVSSIQYDAKTMTQKPVYETISRLSILGLSFSSEEYSVHALIYKACQDYDVDAVINTCIDDESSCLLGIFYGHTMRLTGLGIKFSPMAPEIKTPR